MTIREIEETLDQYFRHDHPEGAFGHAGDIVKKYNAAVNDLNSWQDEQAARIESRQKNLEQLSKEIEAFDRQIEAESSNELIDKRNAVVDRYNQLGESISGQIDVYNEHQRQRTAKLETIKSEIAAANQIAEEVNDWFDSDSDLVFFRQVNNALADARDHLSDFVKLQTYRRELGEWAAKEQQENLNGVRVIEVTLCGLEPSWMVMDTGATNVTISPSLVKVLQLENHIGDDIECRVAGGGIVKGKKIIIPEITALGSTLTDIDAIVLDESGCGIDGLLGMSFLSKVDEFRSRE